MFLTFDIIWATAKALGGLGQIVSSRFRIGQVELADEEVVGLLGMNSNGIALFSILAVAFSILLMNKKHMRLWLVACVTTYATVVGLLTVSKTFVLVYIVFWMLYFIWYVIKSGGNIFKPLGFIAGIGLVFVVILQTDMAQNVIYRFVNEKDLTTGRVDIFWDYWNIMLKSPFDMVFGVGIQNTLPKTGMDVVPHNAFLELYVCLGILGVALYTVFFIFLVKMGNRFRRKKHETKHAFITLLPFIIYFIFIQGMQFLRINYVYALLPLVFACMVTLNKDSESLVEKLEN